jgi:hypothetical protein
MLCAKQKLTGEIVTAYFASKTHGPFVCLDCRDEVPGATLNLATDFAPPRERDWWGGNGLTVPTAKIFHAPKSNLKLLKNPQVVLSLCDAYNTGRLRKEICGFHPFVSRGESQRQNHRRHRISMGDRRQLR